jgi:excinuclease UvrABC nuclease subunit
MRFKELKLGSQRIIPKKPGIYFLCLNIELIYIGETNNLRTRIENHNSTKNLHKNVDDPSYSTLFNRILYCIIKKQEKRKKLERLLIEAFQPKLNDLNLKWILLSHIRHKRIREGFIKNIFENYNMDLGYYTDGWIQ